MSHLFARFNFQSDPFGPKQFRTIFLSLPLFYTEAIQRALGSKEGK